MIRRLARSSIAAGVALAGGVAFAGFGVAAAVGTDEGGVPAADADELALVERFAGAVTTFDAGQVEADIERILALGTPTFADEFRSTMGETFVARSEEHTSELQSLMRTSYAVFGLKKKNK